MKNKWTEYEIRLCRTMHECCLCKNTIYDGEPYFDGGYGKRAHKVCGILADVEARPSWPQEG